MTTTLSQFIIENQNKFPHASGEFSRLMNDIATAAKIVNREVNRAGLADILGEAGNTNVQGEEVKKLDVFANDQFIAALRSGGECCAIISEEDDEMLVLDGNHSQKGQYIVAMDPLDGSSNIDVNVSVGTIFSVFKRKSASGAIIQADVLQSGNEQIAAGYVIYGSSTMLVYTTGSGVNGFTLDPSIGEFCLSHPNLRVPANGKIYSLNEGNIAHFPEGVKRYVSWCQEEDKATNRPYSARYIGSMVADFHRNLLKGGIFMYPATAKAPNGKLRLMYECNPLSFVIEQAGGAATDGKTRIMDLAATELHQRTPIYIGSAEMVKQVSALVQESVTA